MAWNSDLKFEIEKVSKYAKQKSESSFIKPNQRIALEIAQVTTIMIDTSVTLIFVYDL